MARQEALSLVDIGQKLKAGEEMTHELFLKRRTEKLSAGIHPFSAAKQFDLRSRVQYVKKCLSAKPNRC